MLFIFIPIFLPFHLLTCNILLHGVRENMRNDGNFRTLYCRTAARQKFFVNSAISTWNDLPSVIRINLNHKYLIERCEMYYVGSYTECFVLFFPNLMHQVLLCLTSVNYRHKLCLSV